jgi:hypothetical protein
MVKHTVKMDGKSLSPQKELSELLKFQFPQIFAEGKVNPGYIDPHSTHTFNRY